MANYEYRILQRRERWTMGAPYDEWTRATYRDFDDSASARGELAQLQGMNPAAEYRLLRRAKVQAWKDIRV